MRFGSVHRCRIQEMRLITSPYFYDVCSLPTGSRLLNKKQWKIKYTSKRNDMIEAYLCSKKTFTDHLSALTNGSLQRLTSHRTIIRLHSWLPGKGFEQFISLFCRIQQLRHTQIVSLSSKVHIAPIGNPLPFLSPPKGAYRSRISDCPAIVEAVRCPCLSNVHRISPRFPV